MYQFSRSIYRELAGELLPERSGGQENHRRLLSACEQTIERIAADRRYFARPAKSLFQDVRTLFPMSCQLRALRVIEREIAQAVEFVDEHAQAGVSFDGSPLHCRATTRKGSACQRMPLPASDYCPSHKHLEESFDGPAVLVEALDRRVEELDQVGAAA